MTSGATQFVGVGLVDLISSKTSLGATKTFVSRESNELEGALGVSKMGGGCASSITNF